MKILQYGRNVNSLTEVTGDHLKGASNIDVKLVNIEKSTYRQIPKNIVEFFPNLEGFMFQDSNLKKISSDDLKSFSKLRYLTLMGNKIELLDNDLFIHTPRLVYINLSWNLIKHIGTDTFKPLPDLHTILFYRNVCSSSDVWKESEEEVKAFIAKLSAKCKPTSQMIDQEEDRRKKTDRRMNSEI